MENVEWDEEIYAKVKEFVDNTPTFYDTNDVADYIMHYRDEILKIIK